MSKATLARCAAGEDKGRNPGEVQAYLGQGHVPSYGSSPLAPLPFAVGGADTLRLFSGFGGPASNSVSKAVSVSPGEMPSM